MELVDNDVATSILSCLPAKDLMAFKCTGKRWNSLISDPSFLHMHGQRENVVSGLFVQEILLQMDIDIESVNYIPMSKGHCMVQDKILDFLPEKVVLMATVGGLLCCRNCIYEASDLFKKHPNIITTVARLKKKDCQKRLVIYICNPATKKWTSLSPGDCPVGDVFGLVLCPFSSSNSFPNFKLVSIMRSKEVPNAYSFAIYSSETQSWKISKEVCNCSSNFYPNTMVFVNQRFHWLTFDHHIITFHVEQEFSRVIKLPGVTPYETYRCRMGICLGESGGDFHYICAHWNEIQVWMLKGCDEPSWILKHQLPLVGFYKELSDVVVNPYLLPLGSTNSLPRGHFNSSLTPLAFRNEVLFMMIERSIVSYSFNSREIIEHCGIEKLGYHFRLKPTVLPYFITLASLDEFGRNGALLENNCSKDSNQETNKRRKRNQVPKNQRKGNTSQRCICKTWKTEKGIERR